MFGCDVLCLRGDDVRCWNDFFFFKQKTAYEIYQCDWSSDVCSSDLAYTCADSPLQPELAWSGGWC